MQSRSAHVLKLQGDTSLKLKSLKSTGSSSHCALHCTTSSTGKLAPHPLCWLWWPWRSKQFKREVFTSVRLRCSPTMVLCELAAASCMCCVSSSIIIDFLCYKLPCWVERHLLFAKFIYNHGWPTRGQASQADTAVKFNRQNYAWSCDALRRVFHYSAPPARFQPYPIADWVSDPRAAENFVLWLFWKLWHHVESKKNARDQMQICWKLWEDKRRSCRW